MAIVGVVANSMHQDTGGAIVQNFATVTHNFGPSSIWGHPSLQMMETLDDDAFATVMPGLLTRASIRTADGRAKARPSCCLSAQRTPAYLTSSFDCILLLVVRDGGRNQEREPRRPISKKIEWTDDR